MKIRKISAAIIGLFLVLFMTTGIRQYSEAAEDGLSVVMSPDYPFRAIVVRDLPYTSSERAVDVIVSGMAFADDITNALVEQVIHEAPDAFIMTGDNTNSGARKDAEILAGKLSRIREAGIPVIVTTGNHDMRVNDPTVFEDCYWNLFDPVERDPASLSYVQIINGTALFAMDDNAVEMGGAGRFSPNTMEWLKKMLETYAPVCPVVFLCHHNVLVGLGEEGTESYRIQNEDLAQLLRENNVHLILSGHLHSQMLEEWNGVYEVVNAMPLGGEHAIGKLEITRSPGEEPENENNDLVRMTYGIEPMNLETYGREGLAEELAEKDLLRNERFRDWFYQILERTGCPETERDLAADLMEAFFRYYEEGILADHKKEILMNPVYQVMIDALWDTIYGPWMKATLETTARNAGSVEISYLMENADKLPVR